MGQEYDKRNISLYRDDGLAAFKAQSGPQNEKNKKAIQKIFRDKGLDITIQCNMKIVDYLDVTMNLNEGSFRPFRKPDDKTNYILHAESDHPPNIIRQLPVSVEKRLSFLCHHQRKSSTNRRGITKTHLREADTRMNLRTIPPWPDNDNERGKLSGSIHHLVRRWRRTLAGNF